VNPDYEVVVRTDVLQEIDGPMLRYGLQQLHGSRILLPAREALRPDRNLLEIRFEEFRKAG
jgi:putative restriction endonuclease